MQSNFIEKYGFYDSRLFYKNLKESPHRKLLHYEIEVFAENSGVTFLDGQGYKIRKGMALIAKPGQIRHSILPFQVYYIHIRNCPSPLRAYLDQLSNIISVYGFSKYAELFSSLVKADNSSSDANDLLIQSRVYEIIYLLYVDSKKAAPRNSEDGTGFPIIQNAMCFMNENYALKIDLNSLSIQANLSPIYFHNLFKHYLGITPRQYLLGRRLSAAKNLLAATSLSITEIAFSCGFNSQSYFNTCFKENCHVTPAQFRKDKGSLYEV